MWLIISLLGAVGLWSMVSKVEIGVPSDDEERGFVEESRNEEAKAGASSSCRYSSSCICIIYMLHMWRNRRDMER